MNHKQLLRSVSRSFYLSIRFLPKPLRRAVGVAYLLARASDTVADTAPCAAGRRLELLHEMARLIKGDLAESTCLTELAALAPQQAHAGEAVLLERFGDCVQALHKLPISQQEAVRATLETIITGQMWDLEYFAIDSPRQVTDDVPSELLGRYIYQVAGVVGEFWTHVGILVQGEHFSLLEPIQLLDYGKHYGMGLQLVNILRDREEDAARGRCYIRADHAEDWLHTARDYLQQGVLYADSLLCRRMRFSTVLPAWLGLDTLDLWQQTAVMFRTGQDVSAKVKIPRRLVYRRMLQALRFAWQHPGKQATKD